MHLYPAITLTQGQCVKFHQGDFNQKALYETSPMMLLKRYAEQGAKWVHLIDLDGAQNPHQRQHQAMQECIHEATKLGLKVQAGGGVRNQEAFNQLIQAGAHRIILGALTIENYELVDKLIDTHGPEKIVLACDILYNDEQQAYVTIYGWQELSDIKLNEVLRLYHASNIRHIICTDVARDGTLQGPNLGLYTQLRLLYPDIAWQASGGIADIDHLRQLKNIEVSGAVLSSALYYKHFSLDKALGES